jgi:hypothetical protein
MRYIARGTMLTTLSAFLLSSWGCYSYQRIEPAQVAAYEQIRVTYASGSQERVDAPRVTGDTLYGYRAYDDGPIARPVGEIGQIDAKKVNVTQSVLLGVTGGVLVGFGIFVAVIALTHD